MIVPGLEVRELADREILVLGLHGEIPREMLGAAQEVFLRAIRRCTRVIIVDLSRASHVSSSGAGLLAHYAVILGARGIRVLAVRAPAQLMSRLTSTGIERMVPFFDSLSDALERAGAAEGSGTAGSPE